MMFNVEEHTVLSISTAALVVLGLVALAVWLGLHRLPRSRSLAVRWTMALVRVAAGFAALLLAAQLAMRGVQLATNLALWPIALAAAAAVEAVVGLYAIERRTVSRLMGRTLAGLRTAAVLLLAVMLAQPVLHSDRTERLKRTVAILVDDSASMLVPDTQMTAPERLRLAETLGVEPARRFYRLDSAGRKLRELVAPVEESAGWLEYLHEPAQARARAEELHKVLADAAAVANEQGDAIRRAFDGRLTLPQELVTVLQDLQSRLTLQVCQRLADAAKKTEPQAVEELPGAAQAIAADLQRAAAALNELAPGVQAAGDRVDQAYYDSLSPAEKAAIDQMARRRRLEVAQQALRARQVALRGFDEKPAPSLLEKLQGQYGLKTYTFAAGVEEASLDGATADANALIASARTQSPAAAAPPKVLDPNDPNHAPPVGEPVAADPNQPDPNALPAAPTVVASPAGSFPAKLDATDLSAALQKVLSDVQADRLAGVLLLTDGQHNVPARPELLAERLGNLQVPVCSLAVGSQSPPTDAAVLALEAPDTIYAKDTAYVSAKLKLDGLAGRTVRVTLYDGEKPVDVQDVRVPAESYRTQVQLSYKPQEAGLHTWRAEVQHFDDEVVATNNSYPLQVSITDQRVQLLLVDGRPRWEFRYLKNLFASRDRTVKLQYVLFKPDQVSGLGERQKVVAAAGLPADQVEATALPESTAEWLKFDVVILGDVSPQQLGAPALESLRKFVLDRGGTLIVVAGPRHMPMSFTGTTLPELLPVSLLPPGDPGLKIDPKAGFTVALTPEGRTNLITRQNVDDAENQRIWTSFPPSYWRLPTAGAKSGAEVLCFALPPSPPGYLAEGQTDEAAIRQREQFMRANALVALQQAGMGQVLMLTYDRTWRMRYRVGDVYHHKFWGQVLRWATAHKLPAGTDLVRIGSDRARYAPGSRVRIRGKVVRADLSPVVSDEVAVQVYEGQRLVLRRKMEYQPDSAGLYVADLGEMPSGSYRVELEGPAVQDVLAGEGVDKVSSEFFVAASGSTEQTELSANHALLERLAALTGGSVADASRAADLADRFGPAEIVRHEHRQWVLWDSWLFLALVLALLTAEWVLRKKAGLA